MVTVHLYATKDGVTQLMESFDLQDGETMVIEDGLVLSKLAVVATEVSKSVEATGSYSIINHSDGNEVHQLSATEERGALFEALELLGWGLINEEDEEDPSEE